MKVFYDVLAAFICATANEYVLNIKCWRRGKCLHFVAFLLTQLLPVALFWNLFCFYNIFLPTFFVFCFRGLSRKVTPPWGDFVLRKRGMMEGWGSKSTRSTWRNSTTASPASRFSYNVSRDEIWIQGFFMQLLQRSVLTAWSPLCYIMLTDDRFKISWHDVDYNFVVNFTWGDFFLLN